MTSTFTTNKRIEKPASGDYANTWAAPVNGDWDVIDTAFGGTTSLNAVGASGTVVLTTAQYRPPLIVISGSITGNINYQLPAGIGGYWFVYNATTTGAGGPYAIVLSSAGGGSTVTLAQGYTTAVICDGTNVGRADSNPAAAGGSTTQVQYNNAGLLAGSASLTWGTYSATFTGTIAASSSTLVTTGVTGTIRIGMTLGTITGGTFTSPTTVTILSQISGTIGGAGSYTISQTNTGGAGATVGSASYSALAAPNVIGNLTGNAATATLATTATTATYASTVTGTALAIGYLQLPQNSQSTAYVAAAGDVGKHIYTTSNVTLNPSVFSAGDAFVIVNSNTATTSITVIAGTGVVLRIAGTTTSGTPRTLAPNGVISALCVVGGATPTFLLSGSGLS
jgi:hypothetical protein